jgi:hypothetical protein
VFAHRAADSFGGGWVVTGTARSSVVLLTRGDCVKSV